MSRRAPLQGRELAEYEEAARTEAQVPITPSTGRASCSDGARPLACRNACSLCCNSSVTHSIGELIAGLHVEHHGVTGSGDVKRRKETARRIAPIGACTAAKATRIISRCSCTGGAPRQQQGAGNLSHRSSRRGRRSCRRLCERDPPRRQRGGARCEGRQSGLGRADRGLHSPRGDPPPTRAHRPTPPPPSASAQTSPLHTF